jgi:hypothetical protein
MSHNQVSGIKEVLNTDEPEENWKVKVRLKSGGVFPNRDMYLNWQQLTAGLQELVRDYVNKEGSI